ncbi:uncharacterized protein LOC143018329 [Oratosquilla oratoria]|uniref:uncharacterized protein LOC143018329 n=1 Tax=Oratosquilla oratoria TaxID=337810 RepID=UPI003F774FE7
MTAKATRLARNVMCQLIHYNQNTIWDYIKKYKHLQSTHSRTRGNPMTNGDGYDKNVEINGVPIRQKESVKYLEVTWDGKSKYESAVEARIAAYSQNLGLLYLLMKDRNVPTAVKIVIYKSILRLILTYGCEYLTLTTKTSSKVQAAEMREMRLIKGVTRFDHRRNDTIRQELAVESILEFVERAQLRWFGHVERMDQERTPKRWIYWTPTGKRPVGRPRKRWIMNIDDGLRRRGPTLEQIHQTGSSTTEEVGGLSY